MLPLHMIIDNLFSNHITVTAHIFIILNVKQFNHERASIKSQISHTDLNFSTVLFMRLGEDHTDV